MSFLIFLLCGIAGGVLGGMGMGGGTLLIPLLTAVCGVKQTAAQGVNLLCFLPMSAVALAVHAKSGLLKKRVLRFNGAGASVFGAVFGCGGVPARIGAFEGVRTFFDRVVVFSVCFRFTHKKREKTP